MKQFCRICLKAITDLNFVAMKISEPSQIKMQLSICVPEMVVDLVKDAIFCKFCVNALHSAYNFKNLCLSTEQHIQNYSRKLLHSKSIEIEDLLHDLQRCTRNGVCEIKVGGKNTMNKGFAASPNMNLLLSDDENLGGGQNFNTESSMSQRPITLPVDASNIINAINVVVNDFTKPALQVSADELNNLLDDDKLENVQIQPQVFKQKSENECEDITIKEEDIALPKLESSSYEGFEDNLFEDVESEDNTPDVKSINNEIEILQTDIQTQSCFVQLTRLPDDIVHKFTSRTKYYLEKHELIQERKFLYCASCNFHTVHGNSLIQHMQSHTSGGNNTMNEEFAVSPNINLSLSDDENVGDGQNISTESNIGQLSVTLPVDTSHIVNAVNIVANDFSKPAIQVSTDELTNLLDDPLENILIQRQVFEQESETEDITIKEEDISLPKLESSSYKSFEDNLFEDAESEDHTADVKNMSSEIEILQRNVQAQSCFVKLTRLPDDIVHKFTSRTKYYLKNHELIQERKFLYCVLCNFYTVHRKSLIEHRRTHSSEKAFACNVCTYRSTYKSNLQKHQRIHTGERPFTCNVCNLRYSRKETLRIHLRSHTGEKPFACNVCTYQTSYKCNLQKHQRTHTGERQFTCKVCNLRCSQKETLRNHLLTHTGEKPFACNVCNFRCLRKRSLQDHLRTHTGEKPFACNVCNYRCSRKKNLQYHLRTHSGEKPFACNVCNYRCLQMSHLQFHLLTHTGEKPFVCNVCNYCCSRKGTLKMHLRTHTGEKPFGCNECNYRCSQKSHLQCHLRTHSGEKPFTCNVCTFRSSHQSSLRKHQRAHTGENPFVCN